jgi:carboxymethylenebutenolidase
MRLTNISTRLCAVVLSLILAPGLSAAANADGQSIVLPATERPVTAQFFKAQGEAARPAVVILHGTQGIDRFRAFYQRYATVIARSGIDAYLLSYYSDSDAGRIKTQKAEDRRAVFSQRVRAWSTLVSDVITDILARRQASGRVGLLGFSQGGFLATAVASQDKRVSALTVFYGGVPSLFRGEISHLPPLLELHGDADQTVLPSEGKELVDLARGLGQSAEMVVYPGAGHGFGGTDATDAQHRTVAFLRHRLLPSK